MIGTTPADCPTCREMVVCSEPVSSTKSTQRPPLMRPLTITLSFTSLKGTVWSRPRECSSSELASRLLNACRKRIWAFDHSALSLRSLLGSRFT